MLKRSRDGERGLFPELATATARWRPRSSTGVAWRGEEGSSAGWSGARRLRGCCVWRWSSRRWPAAHAPRPSSLSPRAPAAQRPRSRAPTRPRLTGRARLSVAPPAARSARPRPSFLSLSLTARPRLQLLRLPRTRDHRRARRDPFPAAQRRNHRPTFFKPPMRPQCATHSSPAPPRAEIHPAALLRREEAPAPPQPRCYAAPRALQTPAKALPRRREAPRSLLARPRPVQCRNFGPSSPPVRTSAPTNPRLR